MLLKDKDTRHKRAVIDDYNNIASLYDKRWKSYLNAINTSLISDLSKRHCPENIIDIGCGTGLTLDKLQNAFPHSHIFGVDVNKSMLEQARQKLQNQTLIKADITNNSDQLLNDYQGACDVVMSLSVMHHLKDHKTHLQLLHKLCQKDGFIYLADFEISSFKMRLADTYWRIMKSSYGKSYTHNALINMIISMGLFDILKTYHLKAGAFWRMQLLVLKPTSQD